jgi:hypothetical protein
LGALKEGVRIIGAVDGEVQRCHAHVCRSSIFSI